MDLSQINKWIGKEQRIDAVINVEPANLMNAALNRDPIFSVGDLLPPAWHWLYFHEGVRADGLGVEGHEELGGFMPPIHYAVDAAGNPVPPRRMWAGGSIAFLRPLRLGFAATKRSIVQSITPKEGRSGNLCFVVVVHEISVEGEACLREEQTIVYRDAPKTDAPKTDAPKTDAPKTDAPKTDAPKTDAPKTDAPKADEAPVQAKAAPANADFSLRYEPDPILLFRYSALTFNAHRIHYDVDFCRQHEGYPDLVVHGPLTATLLLDLYYNSPDVSLNQTISHFTYRGLSPLFNPNPFTINGTHEGNAWAANYEGGLAMTATVLQS